METFHSPTLKASTKVINVTTNKAYEQARVSFQLQDVNTLVFTCVFKQSIYLTKDQRKYSVLFKLHHTGNIPCRFYGYILVIMTKKQGVFNGENNRLYPISVVSGGKRKKLLPNTTVSTLTKYLEIHCKVMFQSYLSSSEKSLCMH